jgi:hypothetical protein
MKGDAHALSRPDPARYGSLVNASISTECSYHYTINTFVKALANVLFHLADFIIGIEEIASTRTNEHMHLEAFNGTNRTNETNGGGDAPHFECATEFHALRSSCERSMRTLHTSCTYFKNI